jgi:hypothetical protein
MTATAAASPNHRETPAGGYAVVSYADRYICYT